MKLIDKIVLEDVKKISDCTNSLGLRNKSVLLTGANGLIGSYLAYFFSYLNEELNYKTKVHLVTKSEITENSRIYALLNANNFLITNKDLSEPNVYNEKYDFIVHAAGYAAPAAFLENPVRTIDVNYIGIKSILESAVKTSPHARILYLSSSEIYGSPTPESFPTPETYEGSSSITNNRACYIESKRLSEVLCLSYMQKYGLNIRIARPALSYGPGLSFDDERVISQFMKKAHLEKVINMVDDGRDLRSFCYMSDVLRQLLNILLFSKDAIYNVGSQEEEVTIKELALLIGELMGTMVVSGPGKDPSVIGAPSRVCLSMKKMENEFGFKPQVALREGLKRTIEWNLAREKSTNS
ncbi:MAG: dTDP-glucose 4,6-dehydratase [Parcubacteria group bacterium Gr01-1014_20]|nr:MAG: dTDP-glucose 4,6-dehydratase [Parcubacteria group bacterium Gr01-1014_20]